MAYAKTDAVKAMLANLPEALRDNVLRGAARAAADVVATEAREQTKSAEVRGSIKVASSENAGKLIAKVQCKGPGAYLAPWEEYGTAPHVVSVHPQSRSGRLIPQPGDKKSLVIDGKYVGATVHHPGARAHPFLRPALDNKAGDALDAAQSYINKRLTREGVFAPPDPEPEQ